MRITASSVTPLLLDMFHRFMLRRGRLQKVLYLLLISIADATEDIIYGKGRPVPNTKLPPLSINTTDKELSEGIPYHGPLEGSENGMGGYSLFRHDDATVFKCRLKDGFADEQREALALRFVLSHTSIPVPRVHRVVAADFQHLIFMDYIKGERLDKAWPTLSVWQKCRVAWILRGYIRQLRRIRTHLASRPGPLGPEPRECRGLMWTSCEAGPFEDFTAFYRRARRCVFRTVDDVNDSRTREEYSRVQRSLVFTHNDLNMRNIILGKDGKVWLIDWDWSGFYPVYFEYIAMAIAAKSSVSPTPLSWQIFVPFITNPFFQEGRCLEALPR